MMAELSSGRKMSRLSYQSTTASSGIMNQHHPKLDRQRNLTLRSRSSRVEPLGRSSLRSKGSSNSSEDKVKMFKNCVRKMIEFLFTQVGVGAVVVCFTIVGASIFQAIETEVEDPTLMEMEVTRNTTMEKLWYLTDTYNTLNKRAWRRSINKALSEHQSAVVQLVQRGFDGRTNVERWTFPTALMFTLRWNVKRKWKQAVDFQGLGRDEQLDEAYMDELEQQVIVPSTTCLWVVAIYLLLGTIMFAEWEGWNYLDSVYFCVISLTKIGFGDLVPGTSDHDSTMHEVKLVINFVYILLGMAIVAMCYYLLREEVTVKLTQFEDKMKDKVFVFKQKVNVKK